jgi:hypothetical protein
MLNETLYRDVRKCAAERGTSISSIVSEALSVYFAHPTGQSKKAVKLTVATGGGWIGPVNPLSNRELLDAIDDDLAGPIH